jgi:hypothetical protein
MLFESVIIQVEKDESGKYQLCFLWGKEYKKLTLISPCNPILRQSNEAEKQLTKLTQDSKKHVQEIKWDELQTIINNLRQSDKSNIETTSLPEYEKMGKKYRHSEIHIYPLEGSTDTEIYIRCDYISGL